MSEMIIVSLIAAVPPTLASLAVLVVALRSKQKIQEIHDVTNGEGRKAVNKAREEGRADGKRTEQERHREA